MATGGRVLSHIKLALRDARNTVLFTGYQAAGTRGRHLVEGAREVKIHGEMVPVAARIELIESMSAHADIDEMIRWLRGFTRPPEATWLVHGEAASLAAMKARIECDLPGWQAAIARDGETVPVDGD
jgi:metallo-beta-lactamase family protein